MSAQQRVIFGTHGGVAVWKTRKPTLQSDNASIRSASKHFDGRCDCNGTLPGGIPAGFRRDSDWIFGGFFCVGQLTEF